MEVRADAGAAVVVVAAVGTVEAVEASAVAGMVAEVGTVVRSVTVASLPPEAEVAVEMVAGLGEVAETAAGDWVAVAAFDRAAEVAEIVVGAEAVAWIVGPVLETGMAE